MGQELAEASVCMVMVRRRGRRHVDAWRFGNDDHRFEIANFEKEYANGKAVREIQSDISLYSDIFVSGSNNSSHQHNERETKAIGYCMIQRYAVQVIPFGQ